MDILEGAKQLLGLGLDPKELTFLHVTVRSVVVFMAGLVMMRLGAKRFLARKTAFDAVLGFVLASMLARAINGSAAFFPTLAGGFVLVGLHRLIAILAFHAHWFGKLVKGSDEIIVEDGRVQEEAMRKNHLTKDDLLEDLRLKSCAQPSEVRCARVERSGEVSVIPAKE